MENKSTEKHLAVSNIGPVKAFEADLRPGMNLLIGENGAGKSSVQAAIARASGVAIDVQVTDGASRGLLSLDGAVLLSLSRAKAKPDPGVSATLVSVSPLATVIQPGIKEEKAREAARIRALISLFPELKADDEFLSSLVDADEDAKDFLLEALEGDLELDPVTVASKAHKVLHARKRDFEAQAEQAHGRWQTSHPESRPEPYSELSVADAQAKYDSAVGDHREAQGSAEQRASRERERAEIADNIGERPDVESARLRVEATTARRETVAIEIAALEERLTGLRTSLQQASADQTAATVLFGHAQRAAATWDRRKEILGSEITGATEADVQNAAFCVQQARQGLEAARAGEEYRKRLEASERAREERERATNMAIKYESLAKAVPQRLGGLLEKAGAPGLTVIDGVLHVTHEDGHVEPFHRLSDGQRTRLIMPIFIQRNPNRVVAFPEEFWHHLEAESRVEIAATLAEHGVYGLTEIATKRGDPLRMEHFDGNHN